MKKYKYYSFVAIKPGFANNEKVNNYIASELVNLGAMIVFACKTKYTKTDSQKHYSTHFRGSYQNCQPYYPDLENYITSDYIFGMVVGSDDENIYKAIRAKAGVVMKKDSEGNIIQEAAPGTIRHEVPIMLNQEKKQRENVLHSSETPEEACTEILVFLDNIINQENLIPNDVIRAAKQLRNEIAEKQKNITSNII